MTWLIRGCIFKPGAFKWCVTHGMLPVAHHLEGDVFRVYFSGRDRDNQSHIGCLEMDIVTGETKVNPEPILSPGTGFMRDGVSPTWYVPERNALYIMGWRQNKKWGPEERSGILHLDTGKIERPPAVKPGFNVAVVTCLVSRSGIYEVYYDGADRFVSPQERYYSIKRRTYYGALWLDGETTVFPPEGSESRTSCFRVLGNRGFFCTAEGDSRDYRIFEAQRVGEKWERLGPIETDGEWCSYPFPVEHGGKTYLLASSREYGRLGFGMYEEVWMERGYNRATAMKDAKADACGTREPGLHPTREKEPRPLQPSDRRVILGKLCMIYGNPPRDSGWSRSSRYEYQQLRKLEKEYGHPIQYLEDWSGFTEYDNLWRECQREFVAKHYKGK